MVQIQVAIFFQYSLPIGKTTDELSLPVEKRMAQKMGWGLFWVLGYRLELVPSVRSPKEAAKF